MALILQEYLLQLSKQRSRHAVKYHDSVVEVHIVRKKHMKIIINKGFKSAAIFRVFSFRNELKQKSYEHSYRSHKQVYAYLCHRQSWQAYAAHIEH